MKFLILNLIIVGTLAVGQVRADEGMWLMPFLEKMNIKDMKSKGFKLSAKDIYDLNASALKDAVVIFGGGCTGEIVSPEGLLFTNHHCGFGSIQQLSSVEHDYLKNGFWAMNRMEELPAKDLSVRFIRKITDVTDLVVPKETLPEADRTKKVKEAIATVINENKEKYPDYEIGVESFFGGNQFLMFAIEEFNDVRLVGTPPYAIGKFGGETDNWMWPRHTGDFSVFRVYSNKEGKPADYSLDNVPYQSPAHLKISLGGFGKGDYSMIIGFPGSTNRYMTSYEIDQVLNVTNPNRIFIRGVRQKILMEDMNASDKVRIQYASKYASSSNYWKNSIGMSRGLKRLNVKAKKEGIETRFTEWVKSSPDNAQYAEALPLIEKSVKARTASQHVQQYISESMSRSVEVFAAANVLARMFKEDTVYSKTLSAEQVANIKEAAAEFYNDYNEPTDKRVALSMFKILKDSIALEQLPTIFKSEIVDKFGGNTDKYVEHLYANSIFANADKFNKFIDNYDVETLKNDPSLIGSKSVNKRIIALADVINKEKEDFSRGHRLFVAGLLEMDKGGMHYPDANFTMRLTYGNILPYKPADAISYDFYTTLSGVMEKEDASNPVDFTVPAKLKELYKAKDFGRYALKGDVPVAFISNNDITGGNSGSPVLNKRGELIGLAFDGNWEAMSGDIAFEPELQRTISVDIRYVLFIIDKFAGAGYLLDEMTIVPN